jgi:hypothetical protein
MSDIAPDLTVSTSRILNVLQSDGRVSNLKLAETALSLTAVLEACSVCSDGDPGA